MSEKLIENASAVQPPEVLHREQDRIQFVKEILPFWKKLTEAQQKRILDSLVLQNFHVGDALHRGGEDCSGLMLIHSGQLRVYILSEEGKEITLYRLFDRDICIFTVSCAMKNISFEVQVEAEKDGTLLLIPTAVYREVVAVSLPMTEYMNDLMASRFSDVMWVMEQVLFKRFDQRLAQFLLDQAAIDGGDDIHMTHETIARHMGSAREVVTRMLKYFQSESMVKLSRGDVTLTDRKALEALTE